MRKLNLQVQISADGFVGRFASLRVGNFKVLPVRDCAGQIPLGQVGDVSAFDRNEENLNASLSENRSPPLV